jgi:tetratricopeptide (TPR) repeat protein
MRSLQYVGRKVLSAPGDFRLDNVSQLNLKLLAPLLDTATTLDPQFMEPYEYAAVVLPGVSVDDAIRITKKGVTANPSAWQLYQQLGYIYWQQQDFTAAGESYGRGAAIPGAPAWMEAMKARMASEGGSRKTAREIYQRMYEQAGDEQIKNTALQHLLLLDSLDQRDGLRKVLAAYREQVARCPTSWRELAYGLRSSHLPLDQTGTPLDPTGVAYVLVNGNCDVDLGPGSTISRK